MENAKLEAKLNQNEQEEEENYVSERQRDLLVSYSDKSVGRNETRD